MGCFGERERGDVDEAQKWDYLTLSDFHATSSWTWLSYLWLWILAIIAVASFAADTFTAVNLLAFDKWSSQIQPAIPLKYSKWIFAICIIISTVLWIFAWLQAIRIIRRGGVAESYMNPLAVSLQSMRSLGWKRFLVFAELTKSKKGVDYVALFVYFQLQGAIRIILAEGPRQVVNALTLWSVMQADIVPVGSHAAKEGSSPVGQFFINIETLAASNREQAVILCSMLFTLVIWVIAALSLIAALVMYLVFLWHYIPQSDGRLSIYCRRKIDRRLEKIVEVKVKAALEESEKKRRKEEAKAAKKSDLPPNLARQPTLPQLTTPPLADDKLPEFTLARQDTQATLPVYYSRPPTRNENPALQRAPTLANVDPQGPRPRPGMPSRSGTQASGYSNTSYSSNAPLLGNATEMGYSDPHAQRSASPMPSFDRQVSNESYASRPPLDRTMTQIPQVLQRHYPPMSRPGTAQPGLGPRLPIRSNTAFSFEQGRVPLVPSISPAPSNGGYQQPYGPPRRQNTQESFTRPPNGPSRQGTQSSIDQVMPTPQRQLTQSSFHRPFSPPVRTGTALSVANCRTPAPEVQSYEMMEQPVVTASASGYVAFKPSLRSGPSPPLQAAMPPRRHFTSPMEARPPPNDYFGRSVPQRSATAPPEQGAYDDLLDDYGDDGAPQMPARSATFHDMRYQGWS